MFINKLNKKENIEFPRQETEGYCAPGCVAVLVFLFNPEIKVDQKELAKQVKNFESWGTTNEELVQMLKNYFQEVVIEEGITWERMKKLLQEEYVAVIDFMDNTFYCDDSESKSEGHSVVIIDVDQKNKSVAIIDPTNKEKCLKFRGVNYRIYNKISWVPMDWIDEQWWDLDVNEKEIRRVAIFAKLNSFKF